MLDFQPSPTIPRFAFGAHDLVRIDGIEYRPWETTDDGYVFVRTDAQGVAQSFSRSEMARLVDLGHVTHERDALLPEGAKARLELPSDLLSTLSDKQHRRAKFKESVALAFLELEQEGRVKRTEESIMAALPEIKYTAARFLSQPSECDEYPIDPNTRIFPEKLSFRTVRRAYQAYEKHGLAGLYDGTVNRGRRERRLRPDELALMSEVVARYLNERRPLISTICRDVERAFDEKNKLRREEGTPELVPPSRETVRLAVRALDPFRRDLAREGVGYARNRYAPVGKGLDLTRPLQRVEIDTWKVDLKTLMATSGLLPSLSDEDKERLGLDKKKGRWHLTVAICATTRCILAMRLCRAPRAQATIEALDMMLRDKGVWSDAVGALRPWNFFGRPELIVTDCGGENMAFDVRVALRDLGIRVEHAPAGLAAMRAYIEAFFKTLSVSLPPRLTGRTFGNMLEKGDYDPDARAALTADDLCSALIRWVVHYYHHSPHSGLDGETPANCWARLEKKFAVLPAPEMERRRLALGTRMERTVRKTGITVFEVRYHSELLANWMLHAHNREVRVRWYSEDIGKIVVELDGEWFEVPAVFERFNGVRAQTWFAAVRQLRARFKTEAAFDEHIVFDAIRHIDEINGTAMRRIGLLSEDWSEDRIKHEEERLFVGFNVQSSKRHPALQTEAYTRFGEELATSVAMEAGEDEPRLDAEEPPAGRKEIVSVLPTTTADLSGGPEASPDEDADDDPGFELEDM